MPDMATPKHAITENKPRVPGSAKTEPAAHRDHLWVLFIIAACALVEVWASWVLIGGMSGFPKIGGTHGLPTDWTLAVTSEAYWGYALYSWLAGAPGPRSRRFAMWSFGAVFVLSLVGQGASHLVPPGAKPSPVLVVFVTSLPVLVLALIAILVHLRQLDREESAKLIKEDSLKTALEAERAARKSAEADLESVRAELATAEAKAETLTRKLTAVSDRKSRRGSGRKAAGTGTRNRPPVPGGTSGAEDVPDIDTEARILALIDQGHSASQAGILAGKSDSYGRQVARLRNAAKKEPAGEERTDGDMATGEQPRVS
jgi:hypothetical protein